MIDIKFVGNKPIIDGHGVSFDTKHDKFEYIAPAIHILHMIKKIQNTKWTENISGNINHGSSFIWATIKENISNIDEIYEKKIELYKKRLKEEDMQVDKLVKLSKEDKQAYHENLKVMQEYRIQRATNKIIYEEIINTICDLINKKKISKITVFFTTQLLHVIESIESTIQREKNAPDTNIEITVKDGSSLIEFTITEH